MTEPTRPQRVAESTADALRRGDAHAFEELYVQLRGDVYNLAARIVGDRGEAEDITQEVFLRAFRHLPGKADQLRPEAWVFKTTVNACYDHLRRRKPAPVELMADREAAAHDGFEQAATAAAVEEALGRLNPRYRTALVLKDLHGLGNAEIAEIMGIARGTVGVLLFRARGAFEKRYREVAPTLGAGLPVAGLALWLPPLPVPVSLMATPAFLTPLAAPTGIAPIAASPAAPVAAAVTPVAAGLAKLAGALTTKVAIVAIAATAVTGGSIAVHEARQADRPQTAAAITAPAGQSATRDAGIAGASSPKTHAGVTAGVAAYFGDGEGRRDTSASGATTQAGDAIKAGDGTGTGDGAQGVSGSGTGTASGATSGTASGTGGGAGGGTQTGDATGTGDGTQSGGGTGTDTGSGTGDTGGGSTDGGTAGGTQMH
jgi:RNA polymerase sigma factor (sigma-70 family)